LIERFKKIRLAGELLLLVLIGILLLAKIIEVAVFKIKKNNKWKFLFSCFFFLLKYGRGQLA
jgi:hypothetical protein